MMSHIVWLHVCVYVIECVCVLVCVSMSIEINEFKLYFKCSNKLVLIVVAGIPNGI